MDGRDAPADGVITGYGKVDGRLAAVAAYDFTVMAGSMGMTGELKVTRLRELALTKRIPMIWLLDSAGARIQEAVGSLFAGTGHLFREEVINSGVIPQVAALMGPCAAGTAYIPGLADFVPMVKGRGLDGARRTAPGPRRGRRGRHPGGARRLARALPQVGRRRPRGRRRPGVHRRRSRRYLSYFPSSTARSRPPVARAPTTRSTGPTRSCSTCCPESNRKPYDMYEVIRRIVDDGDYFDLKPQFAKTIITCLARFGGRPAGIVANQPKQLGGILDNDSADKAARFINLCNAYGIPLVYLMDVPGFMVGTKVEEAGIIRHGAKMLYATANATVPKITVVLRKAYGAGYYVMCGRAYEPDLIVAWPTAEISVMGAEGAVEIIFRKQVEEAEDPVGQAPGADRRLPQDHRRLRRRRQRHDRRRDRPARDAGDDLPGARDGRGQAGRAAVEALGSRARYERTMSLDDPAVITCAISGAIANREQCPAIPYTPEEYARRGAADRRRGRRPHPHPRAQARRRARATRSRTSWRSATRSAAEVGDAAIINFSTGTVGVPVAKRIAYLEAGRPEVAALNMGSMNYAKYSRRRKDFVFKFVFANPFDEIIELLEAMRRLEIKPEHECFDLGHVGSLAPLVDMGLLEAPLHADFVMGVVGGVPPTARNLAAMADNLPGRDAPLGRDRDRPRPVDAGRRRADARRLDPGRPRGQLLPARRRRWRAPTAS